MAESEERHCKHRTEAPRSLRIQSTSEKKKETEPETSKSFAQKSACTSCVNGKVFIPGDVDIFRHLRSGQWWWHFASWWSDVLSSVSELHLSSASDWCKKELTSERHQGIASWRAKHQAPCGLQDTFVLASLDFCFWNKRSIQKQIWTTRNFNYLLVAQIHACTDDRFSLPVYFMSFLDWSPWRSEKARLNFWIASYDGPQYFPNVLHSCG